LLILSQIGLASVYSIANGQHVALGTMTIAYAGSGLLGYFGTGNSPMLTFMRANVNAMVLGVGFLISMCMGGFSAGIFALMAALMFDGSNALVNDGPTQTPGDMQIIGPFWGFFLESWRNN